jgi:hypothetical protein
MFVYNPFIHLKVPTVVHTFIIIVTTYYILISECTMFYKCSNKQNLDFNTICLKLTPLVVSSNFELIPTCLTRCICLKLVICFVSDNWDLYPHFSYFSFSASNISLYNLFSIPRKTHNLFLKHLLLWVNPFFVSIFRADIHRFLTQYKQFVYVCHQFLLCHACDTPFVVALPCLLKSIMIRQYQGRKKLNFPCPV